MQFLLLRKRVLIILINLATGSCLPAQSVSYTHQLAKVIYPDVVQLVANIGNHHHLLIIRYRKKPVVYIYNKSLALVAQQELALTTPDNAEIRLLLFDHYYYLSAYEPKRKEYGFWKIDEGAPVPICCCPCWSC